MQRRLDDLLTIALIVAALSVAFSALQRNWRSAMAPDRPQPTYVGDWKDLLGSGRTIGQTTAPVQIIEFADIECVFCGEFHRYVQQARAEFGDDVALTYIHLPISRHRFAHTAAKAAECAAAQERFVDMLNVLFADQGALGKRSWLSFALGAKVPDTVSFNRCMEDHRPVAAIDSGLAAARRLRVRATPTVLVNGWRLPAFPDSLALREVIRDARAGRRVVMSGVE